MAIRASGRILVVPELPGFKTIRPRNWRIGLAMNAALCALLAVSFATGWIASLLGLTEFGLHKYSSIAAFGLASAHLVLHANSLKAQIRRLFFSRPGPDRILG